MRPFGALPESHPLVGRECPACRKPFVVGDVTTILPAGPGDDPDARRARDEGRPYNAVGIALHWECSTQDRDA